MAYDKIITVHSRLDRRINYALDPDKARDGKTVLCAGLNCRAETACRDMLDTKRRWDKLKGVQGYHLIHSYAPGEVTAAQAQALSLEFARRLLGDRFEAVVATHTDHEHIHSHIVLNSVSFADGRMFRSDFKAYFGDIRGISNQLSREHGLSVTEPKGRGKQYAEWAAEKQGKPTVRGLIRRDIDAALAWAVSMQTFYTALEKQGYTVKRGAKVKHTALKPPGSERFVRLDSLGPGYSEEELKKRIDRRDIQPMPAAPRRYKVKDRSRNQRKGRRSRLARLYLYYLMLLSPPGGRRRKALPFKVRAEVRKLEQYKQQFRLLQKYRIENESQLSMLESALQADIDSLVYSRRELYREKRRGKDVSVQISSISLELRPLRRELRCCQKISQAMPVIKEHIELSRQEPEQDRKIRKEVREHGSER